jgi:hypothetical protein
MRRASVSLRGSALRWPIRAKLSSAGKLIGVSNQAHNRLRQNTVDKRIWFGAAALELGRGKARWIDLAPQLRL